MQRLLLVDDEIAIQHAFRKAIREPNITIDFASTAAEALSYTRRSPPDAIILDVQLPDSSGLTTFQAIRKINESIPVILITGHGTTDLAIAAMRDGAFDFLLKPLELSSLRSVLDRALRSGKPSNEPTTENPQEAAVDDLLIGRCSAMQEVYKAIGRVSRQDVTVLITGESGTGKELVARAIARHSNRSLKPFVSVNCGAIPEALIESELFGHEKGAFTGADKQRIGRFEQANGGTIFLDEIGELPLASQVKLLRVLQERRFERVGGTETITVDVRVIAATNAILDEMVIKGQFRQDLYFRINIFAIPLPPLRDRGDDIDLLIRYFFGVYRAALSASAVSISPDVIMALRSYKWPGNVRELQSVLKQSLLKSSGQTLLAEDLPILKAALNKEIISVENDDATFIESKIAEGCTNLYDQSVKRLESQLLVYVLRHTDGNQLQAANILGITRGNLRKKLRSLNIKIQREIG